ncbi:hypothetical protein [Zhongshania sp.]|uniref:hypothetical protein n=1 Tax=Zhongshania sp. TaxID=1971902 RepID=UPI003563CED8
MSEAKFTKGPWEVDPLGSDWLGSVFTHDGSIQVAQAQQVKPYCLDIKQEERQANAHLIAAAPELYAMLAEIVDDGEISLHQIVRAEKALAKARGEV